MPQRLISGSAQPDLFAEYEQRPDVADELF